MHQSSQCTQDHWKSGNKIKDFESFDIMFFIHLAKQNVGLLGWSLKLLKCRQSKVCLTCSMPCALTDAPSWLFISHLRFSCGNPARLRPWWEHWILCWFIIPFLQMSLYKAFLKQSVISTVVVEKKMTMNILMESCISCFFPRQLRNAGYRSQVQVRVQVTMLR